MLERLSIKLKMLLMVVIPVVVIFAISLSSVLEKYEIMHKSEHIKDGAILATEIGALVHEIQKERGLSAGYLASNGARFKEQLEVARSNIALSKKRIENFFYSNHVEHYPDGFVKELKESLFELEKIEPTRLKVNSFSITKEEAIEHFSNINKSFLFAIEQIGGFNSDADIEKMLNAYANFLLAKEYAGIERAYLIFGFEKKSFSEEEYEKFLSLVIAQDAYIGNFLRQAFDKDKEYYDKALKGELLKEIDKMRNSAKMLLNEKVSSVNPLDWYELATIRIDLLKKIEDHLAFSIMDRADELNKLAQKEMKFNLVFSLAVLVFLLLFGFFTARGLARRIATFKEELERIVSLKDFSRSLTISGNDEITSIQKATNDTILNANQAIQTTKENLEKLKEKNWIKDGLTELSKEISGDIELTAVCQNGLNFVSRYINSKKSALFLHDKDEKRLDFKVGYAFEKSEKPITSFDIGEGVVGQVGFEKKPIYFLGLHENDAMKINTATTKSSATNIYVIPLIFNNELIAVVEFASGIAFEKTEMEFLEEANTLLASAINTSIKNNEVKELLKITEESKIELNERSLALEEANRYMQEQQAELEEANVQLEEQQQQLKISEIELREKNETLKKSQKELELSSKYKSEFLANMSHELRTPLNSIMLLSSLLGKNKKQNLNEEDIKKALAINRAGEELLRLISDILDLSKVESGNMEIVVDNFSSSDFLDEIKEMFEHAAEEKSIYLNIIDDYNGVITTDKNRLSQIARNLLSNSFKFTKEGGVIVRLSKSSDPKRPIDLSIADTGIGIPLEKQKLIFEAFKQADGSTSREYGGTGLGLSISKELAHLLGGEIKLESKPSIGSTFSVILPNLNTNKQSIIVEKKKKPTFEIKPIDIDKSMNSLLIVEDDREFALTLKDRIVELGIHVFLADTAKEAMYIAKTQKPTGIVLDLGLPDMNGIDFLRDVKSDVLLRNIPIHVLSGKEKEHEIMSAGIIGYLRKPIDDEGINELITKITTYKKKAVKDLLIVEDDLAHREAMIELIGNGTIKSKGVSGAAEAIDEIEKGIYDTVVVDLGLKNGSGYDVCDFIATNFPDTPIIVYTGKELEKEEKDRLKKYTDSIIIKTVNSHERLLDEVDIFLHKVRVQKSGHNYLKNTDISLDGIKVLVADDDIKNIFVLDSALDEFGASTANASNGQEALKVLQKNNDIDIVLMDIMMPVMDGYEAIKAIREDEKLKWLPIIGLSAKAMLEDRQKCLEVGADEYMTKPADINELASNIKRLVKK